jgi:hypothetical protein
MNACVETGMYERLSKNKNSADSMLFPRPVRHPARERAPVKFADGKFHRGIKPPVIKHI